MIYVVQRPDNQAVKIGYTSGKVKRRVSSLQTSCDVKLEVLMSERGTRTLETNIHKKLKQYRKSGEWFEWNPEVAEVVHNLAACQGCADKSNFCEENNIFKLFGKFIDWPKNFYVCEECLMDYINTVVSKQPKKDRLSLIVGMPTCNFFSDDEDEPNFFYEYVNGNTHKCDENCPKMPESLCIDSIQSIRTKVRVRR